LGFASGIAHAKLRNKRLAGGQTIGVICGNCGVYFEAGGKERRRFCSISCSSLNYQRNKVRTSIDEPGISTM
jgi:hypothetical protein